MATAPSKPTANFTDAELKKFFETRRFVIASSQQTSAKALRKLAMQIGTKVDKTFSCFSYEEAEKELNAAPSHILITDLFFEKRSGLDLITLQESKFSNRADVATIIMSGDPSSTDTAMMTEANVDAVMLKPFTFENFRAAVYQALANKVKPSQYWKVIESAKDLIQKGELDQAAPQFEAAKKLDPKPTLAYYYQGIIFHKKNNFDSAIKAFEEGLGFNPKDYRCLSGIFDSQMQATQYEAAYAAAARLHKDYPVSTSRILDLVRLSVYCRKYEDILDYYQIFQKIEHTEARLGQVIVAGMLVCSKFLLLTGKKEKGLEVLQNAAKASLSSGMLCLDVFRYFTEAGFYPEAEKYFGQISEELRNKNEGKVLNLELATVTRSSGDCVQLATQILQSGVKHPRVYAILIDNSKKIGRAQNTIDALRDEAKVLFPNDPAFK